jgi:allophanate hydrolase
MSAALRIDKAGPMTTIQDRGRFGMLRHGISASGPMDRGAFIEAGQGGAGAIELTRAQFELGVTSGTCRIGYAGGLFNIQINGKPHPWPGTVALRAGDHVSIVPGTRGNYGYLRFDKDIALPAVLGSISTSTRARLGGLDGRPLRSGDVIELAATASDSDMPMRAGMAEGPIRFCWGLHAELFSHSVREKLLKASFTVSTSMDRMGVRLEDQQGVFASANNLSLVSDAVVPGDIQILGDGTPIVLMRDHQPTGGYPRIATIISADLDRFAQMHPGTEIAFTSVSVEHAHRLLRSDLA